MKLGISSKVWFYIFLFIAILCLFLIFQLKPSREGIKGGKGKSGAEKAKMGKGKGKSKK